MWTTETGYRQCDASAQVSRKRCDPQPVFGEGLCPLKSTTGSKRAPVRPNRQCADTFPGDPDSSALGQGPRFCIPNQLQVVEGPLEAGVHPKAQNERGFTLGGRHDPNSGSGTNVNG